MEEIMNMICEKQHLFEARTAGYHVYRIPGIVVTPNGTVIAHCEARKGRGGDWDPIDICMRRSYDGGLTWDDANVVVNHMDYRPDRPTNNFICIPDRVTGDVHALFCSSYERVYYMKSQDDGKSFGDPTDITAVFAPFRTEYQWRVIAVGPGHGIQLDNGCLVAPLWMSTGGGREFGPGKLGHRPSETAVVYSDDHGATWIAGDFVVRNEERFHNPSETVAVQLSDGRVLFNTRTESETHRRVITLSPDGAANWSPPQFDDNLVEPICFGSIIGFDSDDGKKIIIFTNPGVLERTMKGGPRDQGIGPDERGRPFDRKNLTAYLSEDDCKTWTASRLIEDGPSGYSDLTVLSDGTVLVFYECGIVDRMYDDRYLNLARFHLDWVKTG